MSLTKYGLILILLLSCCKTFAQVTVESDVKKTIEVFFEAFHNKDTSVIKSVVKEELVLQTIRTGEDGNNQIRATSFQQFLTSLTQISDTLNFREELLDIHIQVDGPMAHAWTPYKFWIGDQLRHCGVNSFQLFNDDGRWLIIHLADTRRRQDCYK